MGGMRRIDPQRVREVARSAFWLVPSLCVLAAIGLAIGLLAIDKEIGPQAVYLFAGPPAGARTFLSAITQAMITFTGLVFSITIVVLQLTSSQFSPRVLRTFLEDRTIRLSLGVFLATFVYAIVVLRDVRGIAADDGFVPRIAVTTAFLLVLLSVAMFIRYVAHIINMIRAATIIDSIGIDARKCLERMKPGDSADLSQVELAPVSDSVCALEPGVLVAINTAEVVELARAAGCQIELVPRVGDYLPAGAVVLRVRGDGRVDHRKLLGHLSFDTERTMAQDLAFAFRQLVDIAQRALSPGINDPSTAVQAIDVLHDLLRRLAGRRLTPDVYADENGDVRLVIPKLSFGGYLGMAVGQIWAYGHDAVQVPQRLTLMLMDLAEVALPENKPEIERWLATVRSAGERDPTWGKTLRVGGPG
jgi:uncharacterized membrane protein